MRLVRTLLTPALAAAAVAALVGSASAQLDADNVKDVIKCQDTVQKEAQKFVATQMKAFEKCIEGGLQASLLLTAGAITPEQHEKALDKAEKQCAKQLAAIRKASTTLADNVVKACRPVEALVVGPADVLGFQQLASLIGDIQIEDVEDLAGLVCSASESIAGIAATVQTPPGLVISLPGSFPLDPRCEEFRGIL